MRKLSANFETQLLPDGLYNPIVQAVINDSSLDFEIREGYINIYFQGNSILKLNEDGSYDIHNKFLVGVNLTTKLFSNPNDVTCFINSIPIIKNNIISVKSNRPTAEIEYEQLIIRSNNFNKNVNSELFITDRQYAYTSNKSRFDLSGFYWDRNSRKRDQTVPLTFVEVKYSLNPDIADIHNQINKYYNTVALNIKNIASETEYLKNLKIKLGLINQPTDRLKALETLKISDCISDAKFIIALIDYNPHSSLFDILKLRTLPFKDQIKIFKCGFAIWDKYLDIV